MQPIDTRHFTTHADWCQWLSTRGSLKPSHRSCRTSDFCRASRYGNADD